MLNTACDEFWNFFVLNSGFLCAEFMEFLDLCQAMMIICNSLKIYVIPGSILSVEDG